MSGSDPLSWAELWDAFHDALEVPPDARDAALEARFESRPAALREVRRLLAAHLAQGSTLDRPALGLMGRQDPGPRLGEWSIRSTLGGGGMGQVYLGVRSDGEYEQLAAIKLLDPDPDRGHVFLEERRALARLRHPFIAQFYDSGTSADGRQYLVMEYVEGRRLDAWIEAERPALERRIRLLVDVARAVHHAHRNLIVHLDLKPSNVLVTPDGVPKLIDFGIASAPGTDSSDRALTPAYASPEQLRGEDTGTTSDVYALGVMLFELLAGRRPSQRASTADARSGPRAGPPDALRDAVWPGRTAANDEGLDGWNRRALRRLGRWRVGELDALLEASMHPRVEHRIASAEAFADELQRWLARRPLELRGANTLYRLRAALARHPFGYAAAALAVLTLCAGVITLAMQGQRLERALVRAEAQASRAEAAAGFLRDLFVQADPDVHGGAPLPAADVLHQGAARLDRIADPALRAELEVVLGTAQLHLGDFERASQRFARVLERRDEVDADVHLAALQGMAGVLGESARFAEAETMQRDALRAALRIGGDAEWSARLKLAEILQAQDRPDEAEQALAGIERGLAAPALAGAVQLRLAGIALGRGDASRGEARYREALDAFVEAYGDVHHETGRAHYGLAIALHRLGRLREAGEHYRIALQQRREIYGDPHYLVAQVMQAMSALQIDRGQAREALQLARDTLAMQTALHGTNSPRLALAINNLAVALHDTGNFSEAEAQFRRALILHRAAHGDEHSHVASSLANLALVDLDRDLPESALQLLLEAQEIVATRLDRRHPVRSSVLHLLGRAHLALAQYPEATDALNEALVLRESIGDGRHPGVADTHWWMAWLELARGDPVAARAHADRALSVRAAILGEDDWRTPQARALAAALQDDAADREAVQSALHSMERLRGADDWRVRHLRDQLRRAFPDRFDLALQAEPPMRK